MSIVGVGYCFLVASAVLPLVSSHPLGFSQGLMAVMLALAMGVGGLVSRWDLRNRIDLMKASTLIILCLAVGGVKISGAFMRPASDYVINQRDHTLSSSFGREPNSGSTLPAVHEIAGSGQAMTVR
jgi:hypothetical protein